MLLKAGYHKRTIDRLLLNTSMKRDTNVDLYATIAMLQAAWMSVTATVITNLFRHTSFAATPDASDKLFDEPRAPDDPPHRHGRHFVVFVSVHSDTVVMQKLGDDDPMPAVNKGNETSDNKSVVDEPENNVPTASEAREAVVGVLHCFFGAHEHGEDGMNIAAVAERAIFCIRKMHQHPITDFFAAKPV